MDYENLLVKERLKFCKKCVHKKNDLRQGIICGLTNKKADFKDFCKDFKEDTDRIKKEKERKDYEIEQKYGEYAEDIKRGKSPKWIGVSVAVAILFIGLRVVRFMMRYDRANNNNQSQYDEDFYKELEKIQQQRYKVAAINYLSAKGRYAEFNRKMQKDTTIVLNNKITLKLPRGFRLSITNKESDLPIKATSRGYYFIYNKVKKNKNQSLVEQWQAFRSQFTDKYTGSQFITKKLSVINTEKSDIERIDFEIKNRVETIIGTARIIEYNNERYFFQLVSDAKNASHSRTNQYLKYYVKINRKY